MSFKSVDEIEQFRFDDCQISRFELNDTGIGLELEALIVKSNNSQNANYTDSYAGTTYVRLVDGRIIDAVKDGYRYYDANDVLIREVADTALSEEEIKAFPKLCEGAYLYVLDKDKEENGMYYYTLGVEFADETDNTMADSYSLHIVFSKAVFEWEKYMNRVQS